MGKSLQVDESRTFEKYNWLYERIMWVIFTLILIAGLLGVFGSGYFSDVQIGDEKSDLEVRYSRFLRKATDSQVIFEINKTGPEKDVSLWIDQHILNHFDIYQIMPMPERTYLKNDQMIFTYMVEQEAGKIRVALLIKPSSWGRVQWRVGLDSGTVYTIKQFTYP